MTRTEALPEWAERYAAATTAVREVLTGRGPAVLDGWAALLHDQAGDLVTSEQIEADRAQIAAYLTG